MTHPSPPARAPRPYRRIPLDQPQGARRFSIALAQHGKVAAAARAVGMTRQSAYKLKDRVPVVADGWARAQAIGRERRRGETRALPVQGDTLERRPW